MSKKFKGYPPPGVGPYIQIPLMMCHEHARDFTPVELNVLVVIMRYTYGWHKTTGAISINQLIADVNLDRKTVIKAVKKLEEHGIIKVNRESNSDGHLTNIFAITVDETAIETSPEQQRQVADAVQDIFENEE